MVFTGCEMTNGMQAAAGGQRRQVMVGGKRVKTIDVHAHCVVPEALALEGKTAAEQQFPDMDEVGSKRIAAMDKQGVDIEALSINPTWYRLKRDLAAEICRVQNEKLAQMCATYPDRFVAFASVTLQDPKLAAEQLEHGVKKLGLRGAAVGASCAGEEFSDAKFHPFWAKAESLGVLIFIHPQSTPELAHRFKGNGWLANVIGNPLDTTIALEKLIFEGVFDKYPQLKILAAHGGGFLGSYAPRMDRSCYISPQNCNPNIVLKKKPSEYVRQIYMDALVFTPEALRHLAAEVGPGQIMVGTDHPIPWEEDPIGHIMSTPELSDEDRLNILGENAIRVLGLKP